MKRFKSVLMLAVVGASSAALANGTLSGTVSFSGTPPVPEPLKRNSDPFCAKKQMNDESLLVKGGKLQNAVVRLKNAPGGPPPAASVVMDQQDCMYRPRVVGAVEGQKVEVRNSDGTLHNVHSYAGTRTLFNQAQPPKSSPLVKEMKADSDVVKLKCDVHPWMTGYVVFSKSPYFAVTGEDGAFELKNVPPGTYTLEAWHEKLGTQAVEVKVEDKKTAQAKLTFAAAK